MNKQWTLAAMNSERLENLKLCHTSNEKSMCNAICKREIINNAYKLREVRALTPSEEAVLESMYH